MRVGADDVEARAVVERQRRRQLPLVLQVDAVELAGLAAAVGDRERHVAGLAGSHSLANRSDRKHASRRPSTSCARSGRRRRSAAVWLLPSCWLPSAWTPAARLDSRAASAKPLKMMSPMVRIGREAGLRVADERRDLEVERVAGILIGGDAVVGDLALVLVELGGIEAVDAVDGEAAADSPVTFGDLEIADEAAAEHGDAAAVGQDVGDIGERPRSASSGRGSRCASAAGSRSRGRCEDSCPTAK